MTSPMIRLPFLRQAREMTSTSVEYVALPLCFALTTPFKKYGQVGDLSELRKKWRRTEVSLRPIRSVRCHRQARLSIRT